LEGLRHCNSINEIDLVLQSSIKALARALAKVRRPQVDTRILPNGTLTEHDFADTINLLLSIGEQTVTAINSNVPVSPFPYKVSTHMDVDSRIKVLTPIITVHKSEIPSGRDTSSQATHLQLRQLTWPLWNFVSLIKRISTILQQTISIGNTPCVIYTSSIIDF
jgi:hypothetical protein